MTDAKQLRLVFDTGGHTLRTFAVYENGLILLNGYAGQSGVYVSLVRRPGEWHHLQEGDVLSALREFLRYSPCEITVEEREAESTAPLKPTEGLNGPPETKGAE